MTEMKPVGFPNVTFGIIVLNGEPFTRYCLRALYPFAHEIIVVEGASPNAAQDSTPDGHSIDGTLETLHRFQTEEDLDNKVQIVTRNGFWLEKDEQSAAYAERATGDYLWQVDVDEFYLPEDIQTIFNLLKGDPTITEIAFEGIHLWGGFDYFVESGFMWYPKRNNYHRLFKFGPGYRYVTHRPPTVLDPSGIDVMTINALSKKDTAAMGIYMYHYYAVFPAQVMRKARYYKRIGWEFTSQMERWATDTWMNLERPLHVFHVDQTYSWLKRFNRPHPPVINSLREDIHSGLVSVEVRLTDDIERLINSPLYKAARVYASIVERIRLLVISLIIKCGLASWCLPYFRSLKQVGRLFYEALHQQVRESWLRRILPVKPVVVQFAVNDICNSRCIMCNIWQRKRDKEITPEELRKILADKLFSKVRYVGISGGEPTLRPNLHEIGRALVECLPKLSGIGVITNGLRSRMVVERILALAEVAEAAGIRFNVNVSLDGVGEGHDRNRGVEGNFAAVVEVINTLKQRGVSVSIGCTLTPLNCYGANDVLLWCQQNHIAAWEFRLGVDIKRVYNGGYSEQHPFTPEQRFHLIMFFDKLAHHSQVDVAHRRFYRSLVGQLAFGSPRRAGCDWQSRGVTLDTRGNISYCSVQSPILGSALVKSGWEIFKERLPERERIIREYCDDCQHDLLGLPPPKELIRDAVRMLVEPWKRHWPKLQTRIKLTGDTFRAPTSILSPDRNLPSKWQHVLVTGWYGTETAGDKAILGELLHFVKTHAPGCRVTLTTLDHKVSQQTRRELPDSETLSLMDMDKAHSPSVIESVDAVIIGGGPLEEIEQTGYIWRMFREANRQRKARIIFGAGIGPLYTERMRKIVAAICQMATAGFLRDAESLEYALKLGARVPLDYACDPALAYIQRWAVKHAKILRGNGQPGIATLLRANTSEYIKDMDETELKEFNAWAARQIAQILEPVCQTYRAKVNLLPMHSIWVGEDDRIFNRQVAGFFNNPDVFSLERRYLPLETLLQSLCQADIAVAMRYHGHLFCIALGIPFLSIDYTGKPGKIHSLLRCIRYEQWSEDWRSIDMARARSRFQQMYEERSQWSAYLRQRTNELVSALNQTYSRVFHVPRDTTVSLGNEKPSPFFDIQT